MHQTFSQMDKRIVEKKNTTHCLTEETKHQVPDKTLPPFSTSQGMRTHTSDALVWMSLSR